MLWIDLFSEKGQRFYHVYEMCNTTISNKIYTALEFYSKEPLQMVDLKMNMIIDDKPHFKNANERSVKHASIRKYSYAPFPNFY